MSSGLDGYFKGKVVVVTGGAGGIGTALVHQLLGCDAKIAVLDLDVDSLPVHDNLLPISVNITDSVMLESAVDKIHHHFGRIDILLTAAGVGDGGPVGMLEEETWDRVIDINLKGTFLSVKAVLDTMTAQRSGSIITIASVEGLNGTEGGSAYNASKGGVVLLSKNVAIDYGRMGIRCNAICPGFIDTPLLNEVMDLMPAFREDVVRETKVGRLGKPEEIAGAAYFLASDDSAYVTGHTLVVDGGYTAGHSHGIVQMMGLV